jgi:hypothetical protein
LLRCIRASIIAGHVLVSPLAALALPLASAPMGLPIHWDTPPACVDTAVVSARVGALVGEGSASAAALRLGAEPHGEGWRVSLVLEAEAEASPLRRTLAGRDCATLTEAVALVVAVHLDAVATAGVVVALQPEPPDAPAIPEPGEGAGERATRSPVDPSRVSEGSGRSPVAPVRALEDGAEALRRARPRALASMAVAGELGVLPRGAAAFELAGGVGWSRVRVELGAVASVGPGVASERLPTVGGRFALFTGVLRGCGVARRSRVELPLCGGLELGDLRASGTGLRRPATVDALWVAAVASARPQWSPRPRLAVGALLDVVVPLRRHRFATPEAGLVHAVDPVAVRLGLRVELRLP